MKEVYLLVFDRDDQYYFDYISFHNNLVSTRVIETWWHYLQSAYILICNSSLGTLLTGSGVNSVAQEIRKLAPNKKFLLISVKLGESDGWLDKAAWDWINQNK